MRRFPAREDAEVAVHERQRRWRQWGRAGNEVLEGFPSGEGGPVHAEHQGLTIVRFPAQRKRFLRVTGCM